MRNVRQFSKGTLMQFENAEELVKAVAARFLNWFSQCSQPSTIALSGGRMAAPLFGQIVSQSKGKNMVWDALRFFWADERCLPHDHVDSNFHLAKTHFFDPLNISRQSLFPFDEKGSPKQRAKRGREMIQKHCGDDPVFDLIFLGMGEDGHIASLFPENFQMDRDRHEVCFEVKTTKSPANRITLSYRVLAAAREIWIVISGKAKIKMLNEALMLSGQSPLVHLFSLRKHSRVFTDLVLKKENLLPRVQSDNGLSS